MDLCFFSPHNALFFNVWVRLCSTLKHNRISEFPYLNQTEFPRELDIVHRAIFAHVSQFESILIALSFRFTSPVAN